MTWQNIMGEITDDCVRESKFTSSRRGMVKWIRFTCMSFLGQDIDVEIDSEGQAKVKDTPYLQNKIIHWTKKGNKQKIEMWKQRLEEAEAFNLKAIADECIEVNVNVPESSKIRLRINDVTVDQTQKEILGLISDKEEDKFALYCALHKKGYDWKKYEKKYIAEKI